MQALEQARSWLAEAKRVAVLTGAGISQESGVPVFRGPSGLWRQYRAEDLATPQAFARDPKLVWEWYDWRRSIVARAEPNPAHFALVQLERRISDFTLVTQNVDGLHDRAGSRKPLKLHGDMWTVRCVGCVAENVNREVPLAELPPRCSYGSLLRPGVVWFGESLPVHTLNEAYQAAERAQVFLVIGTSGIVQPAASLPLLARRAGARVIEVNAEETPLSSEVDLSLIGPASHLLPELVEAGVRR